MPWKLFLDDQIDDPNTPSRHAPYGFLKAASSYDAKMLVVIGGMPDYMDLDHDLGGGDDAVIFLNWLAEEYPNGPVPKYNVHSANPVGVARIKSFMNSWQKSITL